MHQRVATLHVGIRESGALAAEDERDSLALPRVLPLVARCAARASIDPGFAATTATLLPALEKACRSRFASAPDSNAPLR